MLEHCHYSFSREDYFSSYLLIFLSSIGGQRDQEVDESKIELTAWSIISKEGTYTATSVQLSNETLFKMWKVFNKLISDDSTTVHVEEVSKLTISQ